MTEQPLNAAQLEQIRADAQRAVNAYCERLQLRKWAVEQTLAIISSPSVGFKEDDIVKLARQIYDFTVLPFNPVFTPDKPF